MICVEKSLKELTQEIYSLSLQMDCPYALGARKALEWIVHGGIPPSAQHLDHVAKRTSSKEGLNDYL